MRSGRGKGSAITAATIEPIARAHAKASAAGETFCTIIVTTKETKPR